MVFIPDQNICRTGYKMVWYVPCLVRFVLIRDPFFNLKRGLFRPKRDLCCPKCGP